MANVEDRVVSMSFESSKFESGVNSTLTAIEKLKQALSFPNAGKGLQDIDAAGKKVDLTHIGGAVDSIKEKLSTLSVAGLAIFANLATKAVSAGADIVKSLTITPVLDGLKEYETGLNTVQTILANTQAAGTKLKDVNAALLELNKYSDKTIYNFGEMAKNVGTFTAAGVDLKTSVASIKGIANLAALSGSNSQQAATAMYQLSQAISSGRVSLQDWNSVVNAGMGGTIFQRALAQTAERMGTLDEGAVKLTGKMKNVSIAGQSFRESIQAKPGEKSWLTSDVLTKTLQQFTGDMTDAQLKAEGFSAAQIKAIQLQAKTAENAATQVKTLSGVLDTAKEAAGSGWAQTWQIIFGDFGEAKTLFTAVSNSINGFIGASADARNKVLGDWKELGGRTVLIKAIKEAFDALKAVLQPIKDAFRDIFPATTGKQLYDLTLRFKEFVATLKPGPETITNLHRTFAGLFALLDIGKQIIGGIFTVFGRLFGVVGEGGGGFLNLTGNIGDFIVSIDKALKKGDKFHHFFEMLGDVLALPIKLLVALKDAVLGLFGVNISGGVTDSLGKMSDTLSPLDKIVGNLRNTWNKFLESLGGTKKVLDPAIQGIGDFFSGLGDLISNAVKNINWDTALETIRVGLLGGIFIMVKRFFGGGSFGELFGGGVLQSISGSFKALQGSLVALQANIKAKTLKEIAIAVGILAASMVGLSLIDSKKLNSALLAMTVGFGQLLGAMAILDTIGSSTGFIKLPLIAAGMIALATAIGVLSLAVRNLSGLDWEELAKGLTGVSVLLIGISAASGPLSRNSAGMITAGAGITAIAIAMRILASAVRSFGGLSWTELAKGLTAVGISLGIIGGATRAFPPGLIATGAGLIAVSIALKLLASAVNQFGRMAFGTIAKGLLSIGAGLLVIAGAMTIMPANMALQAAGLLLVSVALNGMAKAVRSFGGMSIEQIAKGLGSLAASLAILAVSLIAMQGAMSGAIALGVAAAGLALMAPALKSLGKQSWGQIIKGLISLAGAIAILGGAGLLLAPIAPELLALGAALVLIGGSLALAGAGVALIGTGLSAIAVAGPAAIAILLGALTRLVEAIPRIVQKFVLGLAEIAVTLAESAPKFVTSMAKILTALLNTVIEVAPKMGEAFSVVLQTALKVIEENFPILVKTGFGMLTALLSGINDNIPQVIPAVVGIVVKLLGTLASYLPRIVTAGATALAALLRGIANNIGTVVSGAADVIAHFIQGIANNISKIASAGTSIVTSVMTAIANHYQSVISTGANIIVKLIEGIGNKAKDVVSAAVSTAGSFIRNIATEALKLVHEGGQAMINFLNGMSDWLDKNSEKVGKAGGRLAGALVRGVVAGVEAGAGQVISSITHIFSNALKSVRKKLRVHSPSLVFAEIGELMMDGLVVGINNSARSVNRTIEDSADEMVSTMVDSLNAIPVALDGIVDLDPVITPILDLTQVQHGARALEPMLAVPVTASASYGQATSISSEQEAVQTTEEAAVASTGTSIKFEQNNYSPESLSSIEIYRQTRNQLSQARNLVLA